MEEIEIKQISEREYWVGENRMYISENIIFLIGVGDKNMNMVIKINEVLHKLSNMVEGEIKIFIDANKEGKLSAEARKVMKESFLDDKIGKIAIYGIHPVAQVIASFIMGVSKNRNEKFFNNTEKAIAWLNE
ncbi:hypothetical protein ACFLR5_00585 [Elusimicrobiota bacterium]